MKIRGGPGGLPPRFFCGTADLSKKISRYNLNNFVKCAFQLLVRFFWWGILFSWRHRTGGGGFTPLRVSPALPFMSAGTCRCQNRPILFEQSSALAVLKLVILLLFMTCVTTSLFKSQHGRDRRIKASHAKGCLRM